MEKIKYVLLVVLFSTTLFSQETSSSCNINSIEISPIGVGIFDGETAVAFNGAIQFNKNKNYVKLAAVYGQEINTVTFNNQEIRTSYTSFELLYGRRFSTGEKSSFNAFVGASYFSAEAGPIEDDTFGVPVHLSQEFNLGNFVLGPQLYANFNDISVVATLGILLKWNFK